MEYRYPSITRDRLRQDAIFAAGVDPGWPLPDFDLPTTDGGRVRKSDFQGRRPLLVTFASLTCPNTASAGPVLRRLHRAFGDEVAFLTVYVRERHPGDRVPQPRTLDWKLRHARAYRARDGIPWSVAVDDLEGTFHRRLGENPNAAFLVDAAGNVAFRTLWSNDGKVLAEALGALARGRSDRPFERERRLVPTLAALARTDAVLRAAGERAVRDLRREAPLRFALSEAAFALDALTPLGRLVLLGAVAGLAGAVVGGALAVRRARR